MVKNVIKISIEKKLSQIVQITQIFIDLSMLFCKQLH